MIDRQLNRAMTQLQQLQKNRKSKSPTKHDTITSPTEHITCAIPKPSPCTNLSRQNTNAPNEPTGAPSLSCEGTCPSQDKGGGPIIQTIRKPHTQNKPTDCTPWDKSRVTQYSNTRGGMGRLNERSELSLPVVTSQSEARVGDGL